MSKPEFEIQILNTIGEWRLRAILANQSLCTFAAKGTSNG